jgi:hypothetical protein
MKVGTLILAGILLALALSDVSSLRIRLAELQFVQDEGAQPEPP